MSKNNNVVRSQALFALAWFHAVMQERRNYIPQVRPPAAPRCWVASVVAYFASVEVRCTVGENVNLIKLGGLTEGETNVRFSVRQGWTKFYEFSMADLRAGAEMIDRLCTRAGETRHHLSHKPTQISQEILSSSL